MSLILDAMRKASRRKSEAESGNKLGNIPTTFPTSFFGRRKKTLSLKILLAPVVIIALFVAFNDSLPLSILNPVARMKTVVSKISSEGKEISNTAPKADEGSSTTEESPASVQEEYQAKDVAGTTGEQGVEPGNKAASSIIPATGEASLKGRQASPPDKEGEKKDSLPVKPSTDAKGTLKEKYTLSQPVRTQESAAAAVEKSRERSVSAKALQQSRSPEDEKLLSTSPPTEGSPVEKEVLSSLSPKVEENPAKNPSPPPYEGDSSKLDKERNEREAAEHFNAALSHQRGKEYDQALQEYEKALKLDPHNVTIYNNMGMIYRNMQRLDEAIRMYEKALFLQPNFEKTRNNLGVAYYIEGKLDKAEREFSKAISIDPSNVESYINLALVYSRRDATTKAMEAFNKALKLDPNNPKVHYNLAILLDREKSYEGAKAHYTRFLLLSPEESEDIKKQVAERIRNLSPLIGR